MNWPSDFINKVICGDCLNVLKDIPDNTIDTVLTDPPYGLEFMGKEWDKFKEYIKPEFRDRYKKQIRKTSKFSETGYKNIPKHQRPNFSGKVSSYWPDKEGGKGRREIYDLWEIGGMSAFQMFNYSWAKECLRIAKPGATLLCFGGTRTYHRLACAIEDAGWIIKDCILWIYGSGFPKATDISQMLDKDECRKQLTEKLGRKPTKEEFKKEWEGFRKKIGRSKDFCAGRGKYTKGDWGMNSLGGDIETDFITTPATFEAQLWNGWKSHGLKPAYEPILVAMKPNEGSYAENALKYGVAGLNINKARIGTQPRKTGTKPTSDKPTGSGSTLLGSSKNRQAEYDQENQGRFPANLILDEEAAKMLDEQSGESKSTDRIRHNQQSKFSGKGIYGKYQDKDTGGFSDRGGASRFFYVAKASRAERDMGLERMPAEPIKGRDEGQDIRNVPYKQRISPVRNLHPTVKPLKLMEYLCLLTKTPIGGIVLDPFAGSGTTGMACRKTGRDYILIEKEKEYCEIAEARIKAIRQTILL